MQATIAPLAAIPTSNELISAGPTKPASPNITPLRVPMQNPINNTKEIDTHQAIVYSAYSTINGKEIKMTIIGMRDSKI
jgi:hypothetical protein